MKQGYFEFCTENIWTGIVNIENYFLHEVTGLYWHDYLGQRKMRNHRFSVDHDILRKKFHGVGVYPVLWAISRSHMVVDQVITFFFFGLSATCGQKY